MTTIVFLVLCGVGQTGSMPLGKKMYLDQIATATSEESIRIRNVCRQGLTATIMFVTYSDVEITAKYEGRSFCKRRNFSQKLLEDVLLDLEFDFLYALLGSNLNINHILDIRENWERIS